MDPLAQKSLSELIEMEDEVDDDVLASYRRARFKQMQESAERNIFGSIVQVGQTEYKQAVTEASKTHTVVVHLMENG